MAKLTLDEWVARLKKNKSFFIARPLLLIFPKKQATGKIIHHGLIPQLQSVLKKTWHGKTL